MYKVLFEYGNDLIELIKESVERHALTIFLPEEFMTGREKASVWKDYCEVHGCYYKHIDFADFSNLAAEYAHFRMTPEYDTFLETVFGHKLRTPAILFPVLQTVIDLHFKTFNKS
ncbi:unnamed protein product [Bursaphelenchus okinawaensis]|uniref:Uncharacterized protein n=1 Tax=Bursaphelenchus okinawaensis TaxID=465554 RepID=A0A811JS77_9BILA|nr:unnamed protein product [Bursaphelenchus okinawaensis]CAG9081180.1 unnamed protein product [Bursaphelenchus okinawaensis]